MTRDEGNKLIAEFMGIEPAPEGMVNIYMDGEEMKLFGTEYHSSWDWLMPVVQKILATDTGTLDVYSLYVEDSLRTANIVTIWDAVTDFIQWYNQTSLKSNKK